MTKKTKHLGRESGKSSGRWWRNSQDPAHTTFVQKHGDGARAGDGKTTDESILGKIVPKFLRG